MTISAARNLAGVALAMILAVALSGCSDPGEQMARAIDVGDLDAVKSMAARHPDSVNAIVTGDIGGRDSMLSLAVDDRRYAIARFLISKGARLDVVDSTGQTPLQSAVYAEDRAMIRLLLRAGAPPNARGYAGRTALHLAAGAGYRMFVELLLSCGADPSLRDKSGKTPADYAFENGHGDIARLLKSHSGVSASRARPRRTK